MATTTFKDNKGREWDIALNASNALEVRNKLGFDITRMFKDEEAGKLGDIQLLVNVVYLLVKPQADVLQVSDYEFGAAMAGDCFSDAVDALWDAVVLFTPSRNRPALQLIRDAGRRLEAMADEVIAKVTPDSLAILARQKLETSLPGVTN